MNLLKKKSHFFSSLSRLFLFSLNKHNNTTIQTFVANGFMQWIDNDRRKNFLNHLLEVKVSKGQVFQDWQICPFIQYIQAFY